MTRKLKAYCLTSEDVPYSYLVFHYSKKEARDWVRAEFSESYDEGEKFDINAERQKDFEKFEKKGEPHYLSITKETASTFRDNMWNAGDDMPICDWCQKGVFEYVPASLLCHSCEKCQDCCDECWEKCDYCDEKGCNCEDEYE